MRLYHGAESEIRNGKFSIEEAYQADGNAAYGAGIYFAVSLDIAAIYAGRDGYIYHVDFSPNKLINDICETELKIIAESVFDALPKSLQRDLASDWASDGSSIRETKRLIVDAVICEDQPEGWLSAIQLSMSSNDPNIVNKLLSDLHGVDGLIADMGDNEDCVVVINEKSLTIRHIGLARDYRSLRREKNIEKGYSDPTIGMD